MRVTGAEAPRGLRWGVVGFVTALAAFALTAGPAAAGYSPPYADIVVDANNGKVLHASNPDSLRHPASLAKIMTLYLLFERLEAGKLNLDTPLRVSAHAAAQAPSKIGFDAGDTIRVEDAIKAIVTRSANDVAVVIAEALGGSESAFAALMTEKAHALGMTRTVYKNASGLPDDAQVTTARDQALLGRAIQERFPQYYKYFSTTQFMYQGHLVRGHNHLLGNVAGVDGIKTGYTHDSGFNLVTSLHRSDRYLVAVVLGGRSAASRDDRMRELIGDYFRVASTKRIAPPAAAGAATAVAKAEPASTASVPLPRPAPIPPAAPSQISIAAPGSEQPLQPIAVKTVAVKPGQEAKLNTVMSYADATPLPPPRPDILASFGTKAASASPQAPIAATANQAPTAAATPARREGWMIQIGAFDQESDAKQRLYSAQNRAKTLLRGADPFTETVTKGSKTYYRARFAGLDKDQAEAACKLLHKNEIACMALKN
ncbi:MAG TPA: D-alanyl-D-alanine carboxypeptidase [Xanthobacteraceae bacterium]|nr:D-alanyl-D-alanine carboxypeptidase [Xanthobacteraceae bacterium]